MQQTLLNSDSNIKVIQVYVCDLNTQAMRQINHLVIGMRESDYDRTRTCTTCKIQHCMWVSPACHDVRSRLFYDGTLKR